jgi:putative transcriptional regulator
MCYNKVKTTFKKVNVKIMPITYNKLWKLLIDKSMTKTDLKNITGMNSATLANMGKNKFISLRMIDKICKELDCQIEDVVEFVREEK